MNCTHCGNENKPEAKFCVNCGAALEQTNTQNTYSQPDYSQPDYNQPNYNQPNYNQPNNAPNPYANYTPTYQANPNPGRGFAIAGMVCGIVSFFCFAYILGLLGIIFGAVAKNKGCKSGMATAGIVCGILGIILWILTQIFLQSIMESLMQSFMYF